MPRMDLLGTTRERIDDFLRVEVGVELMAGAPPATRLVLFDRTRAVLCAAGRLRRPDEPWLDHLVELAYLARQFRPRGLALSFAVRLDRDADDEPRFGLHVLTADRAFGGRAVAFREHPFHLSPEGLVGWGAPRASPASPTLHALARGALHRPRRSRRRDPRAVVEMLAAEGHRVVVGTSLAERMAGCAAVTVVP